MKKAVAVLTVTLTITTLAGHALANALPDSLPLPSRAESQRMFDSITRLVRELQAAPPEAGILSSPPYGQQAASIGTYDGWSFWIGWVGSFSDTYLPESESYAWVVYFAPEGIYVALQSAKSNYSAVNVYASIGTFLGMLVSPDGVQLTKSYVNDLLGVTFSVNKGFKAAAYGPLSGLGVGMERSLGFFRLPGSAALKRALQYGDGYSVSYDLISIPLPGSVSLDYESAVDAGFYPIYLWDNPPQPGEGPIGAIVRGLKKVLAAGGAGYPQQVVGLMAKILLPVLEPLRTSGPVTIDPAVPPGPAQFFGHFLQDNSPTLPASAPEGSPDDLLLHVQEWLQTGDTSGLPAAVSGGFPGSDDVIGDPWDIFRPIHAGTGLAFELGYKRGCDSNPSCPTKYANCIKNIRCMPGKSCPVTVTAAEIAGQVAGSSPAQFEGATVWFDNPSEKFLATQDSETSAVVRNGKATIAVRQAYGTPLSIGARVPGSAATGWKNIELCRRVISFGPEVKVRAADAAAAEAGRDPGLFLVTLSEALAEPLIVRYALGGTASNGVDYRALGGKLTVPAGATSARVRLLPLEDTRREARETVNLNLQWGSTYVLGSPKTASAAIADND